LCQHAHAWHELTRLSCCLAERLNSYQAKIY
jgi:hypothetical protein